MYMYITCTCILHVHVYYMYMYITCTCILHVHVYYMYMYIIMYIISTCILHVHVYYICIYVKIFVWKDSSRELCLHFLLVITYNVPTCLRRLVAEISSRIVFDFVYKFSDKTPLSNNKITKTATSVKLNFPIVLYTVTSHEGLPIVYFKLLLFSMKAFIKLEIIPPFIENVSVYSHTVNNGK